MGEWRAERSPISCVNEDHVDEAAGLRTMVMSVIHGKCDLGGLRAVDDDDSADEMPLVADEV